MVKPSAAGRSEASAALAVTVWPPMLLDVRAELPRRVVLRIAADDLLFLPELSGKKTKLWITSRSLSLSNRPWIIVNRESMPSFSIFSSPVTLRHA